MTQLRFSSQPYNPEGRFTLGGAMYFCAATLSAGAVLGFAAGLLGEVIYVVGLFPLALGMFLGFAAMYAAERAKVRSAVLSSATIVLAALLTMFAVHVVSYLVFLWQRGSIPEELRALALRVEAGEAPAGGLNEEQQQFVARMGNDRTVRKEVLANSLLEFLDIQAVRGVALQKTGGSKLNLGYYGSYIYWVVEVIIVAGFAFTFFRIVPPGILCDDCHEWRNKRILGSFGFRASEVQKVLTSGELHRLRDLVPCAFADEPPGSASRLTVYPCPKCGVSRGTLVTLHGKQRDKKSNEVIKLASTLLFDAEALPVLEAVFPPAKAAGGSENGVG